MSILVYAEATNGKLKKAAFEAASYGVSLAKEQGLSVSAVVIGNISESDAKAIEKFGISQIYLISNPEMHVFNESSYASAITEIAKKTSATIIVLSQTYNSRAIAPRISVKLSFALFSGVTGLLKAEGNGYIVRRTAYSGKAIQELQSFDRKVVLTVKSNSFTLIDNPVTATITSETYKPAGNEARLKSKQIIRNSEKVSLTEADVVVSAGRGMKGPENWGMIEELAENLKAATACSKPVADVHWRPHTEHVGQTGIQIAPNVYIAIGISGAIQHLAGVNSSKTIIVINKDPEAPFFKAADYGIVGDAFTIVPELNKLIKAKLSHN